jgi:hypothetical protein
VHRLLDEAAIRQVLARYARAIDRLDWDLLRSCYHPDATEDRGRYRGTLEGFVSWLRDALGEFESTWHLLGTPLIEFEGGVAWVETYCLGVQRTKQGGGQSREDRLIPCRYCDRFERRQSEWRIARRVAVYEPALPLPAFADSLPMGATSRRDREDYVYWRDVSESKGSS